MPYVCKAGAVILVQEATVPYWKRLGWLLDTDGDGIPDTTTADQAAATASAAKSAADAAAAAAASAVGVTATTGQAALDAALMAGATRDVTVTLDRAMPSASYQASGWIASTPALLGTCGVVGVVSQTASQVVVRVKNTGVSALAVGAVAVQVLAVKSAT